MVEAVGIEPGAQRYVNPTQTLCFPAYRCETHGTRSLTHVPCSTLESSCLPCALVTIWSLRLVSLEDHSSEWIADFSSVQTEEELPAEGLVVHRSSRAGSDRAFGKSLRASRWKTSCRSVEACAAWPRGLPLASLPGATEEIGSPDAVVVHFGEG